MATRLTLWEETSTPITRRAGKAEKAFVARYRLFRDRCRDGPLHTVLGATIRVRKPNGNIATEVVKANAFESMPTYTNRYKRKKRLVPKLDHRPYLIEYFPQELWSALGPEYKSQASTPKSAAERKRMEEQAKKARLEEVDADVEEAERQREEDEKKAEDNEGEEDLRTKKPGEDDDDDDLVEEDDDDLERDEVDDDFEDQEDDESAADDDYNAEKYFDNGEDDDYDDFGRGGDDFDDGGFDD